MKTVGTFRELGPPDLCHIIKAHSKPGMKEVYHLKLKSESNELSTHTV